MTRAVLLLTMVFFVPTLAAQETKKVRLFILSGQSNMAGLKPEASFTPTVMKAFPTDECIVVKSAKGGEPIRRWVKDWKAPDGANTPAGTIGNLYEVLMSTVKKATAGKKLDTISFVWMQGERDAREKLAPIYEGNLRSLVKQLRGDLGRDDITIVIGRLSDCGIKNNDWQALRKAQMSFAEKEPRAAWIDTDDLNGSDDNLHYTKEGYVELGKRFAEKSIELLRK